jgi:hypothetical protein
MKGFTLLWPQIGCNRRHSTARGENNFKSGVRKHVDCKFEEGERAGGRRMDDGTPGAPGDPPQKIWRCQCSNSTSRAVGHWLCPWLIGHHVIDSTSFPHRPAGRQGVRPWVMSAPRSGSERAPQDASDFSSTCTNILTGNSICQLQWLRSEWNMGPRVLLPLCLLVNCQEDPNCEAVLWTGRLVTLFQLHNMGEWFQWRTEKDAVGSGYPIVCSQGLRRTTQKLRIASFRPESRVRNFSNMKQELLSFSHGVGGTQGQLNQLYQVRTY